jgi:ABC-type polar amino acid transport system ATPase subunit
MIEIEDLTYEYADGTVALDAVTVGFAPDHIVAVLGQSGSGKTTLLRCMGRFLTPTTGGIFIDGEDIIGMAEPRFRQTVGIVFQRLHLFPHLDIVGNLTLAPRKVQGLSAGAAATKAHEVLERLAIADLADSYPSQISGGQAQRAAIARGLVLEPAYMLLDEPTSALDANTTDDFAAWLRELQANTQFVIVTHDTLFAEKAASHGVLLHEGRLAAQGAITEIVDRARGG